MLGDYWRQLEQKYGLPGGYLSTVRQIESSGNPNAVSPTGATGPFQFTKGTARQYGLPLDQRTDERLSAEAAARLARDNYSTLQKALGRAPTGGELYMAHQQGGGGAASLLTNMNTPAGKLTNPMHISVNSGDPNAPASALVNKFVSKYDRIANGGNAGQGPTKEAANFMAGDMQPNAAAPAPVVDPTKGKLFGSDAAVKPGGGLVGMAMADTPVTTDSVKNFMSGSEMSAGVAGLGMLAQGLAGTPAPVPQMQAAPIEEHRPDMSLLELIGKRKKKAVV